MTLNKIPCDFVIGSDAPKAFVYNVCVFDPILPSPLSTTVTKNLSVADPTYLSSSRVDVLLAIELETVDDLFLVVLFAKSLSDTSI